MTNFLFALVATAALSAFVLGVVYYFVFGTAHELAKSTKEKKWVRVRNLGIGLWASSTLYIFYLLAREERPSWLRWLLEGI